MELNKNYIKVISIIILVVIIFATTACSSSTGSRDSVIIDFFTNNSVNQENTSVDNENSGLDSHDLNLPWEKGGKTPDQYTWDELEALTDIQKEYFFEWFDTVEAYESWLDNAKPDDEVEAMPWEKGGKTPDQYTWDELEALTDIQKEYFFEWFDSADDFNAWIDSVK